MGWNCRFVLTSLLLFQESALIAYPTPVDFNGSLLRWDMSDVDPPVTYEIKAGRDEDRELFGTAIDTAAALWTDVPTSYFAFAPVSDGQIAQVTINLKSTLDGEPYSAGYAIFDANTGVAPSHCSIHVAVSDRGSYTSISKTLLHELGHCAGLGHSLIPEAIMGYQLSKSDFALDIDDEAALARLYPADGSTPKLPPGCSVESGASAKNPGLLWVLLLLPLATLAFGPRHLRRRRDGLSSVTHPKL